MSVLGMSQSSRQPASLAEEGINPDIQVSLIGCCTAAVWFSGVVPRSLAQAMTDDKMLIRIVPGPDSRRRGNAETGISR